jgi:hypothetical protein
LCSVLFIWLPQLPFPAREILHRCSHNCSSVCLSWWSSILQCLSGWHEAGSRYWTFCHHGWPEMPFCWSHCFLDHELCTMAPGGESVSTNKWIHFHWLWSGYTANVQVLLQCSLLNLAMWLWNQPQYIKSWKITD